MVSKGVHTLEALIGIILVFIALSFLFQVPEYNQTESLRQITFECLKDADLQGNLRGSVLIFDWKSIDAQMGQCLPPFVSHHTRLCRDTCTQLPPKETDVINVEYFVFGDETTFIPTEITVSVWRS